jgi:GntR family transcriptional regulator/MocR family aminotransferase
VQKASHEVPDQTSWPPGTADATDAAEVGEASDTVLVSETGSRELLIDLSGMPRGRLGAELERQIRDAIRSGRLRPGARLPSTRTLAADLGVSRSVAVQAFEQLAAEGYLTTRPGAVARVSDIAPARGPRARSAGTTLPVSGVDRAAGVGSPAETIEVDLRPGSPNLTGLPRAEWGRAVRRALATLTDAELGYGDSRGLPRLREALADYLGRVRGAIVDPQHLVVVNGFAQGLVVVSRLLREQGVTTVAVEDPGSVHTATHLVDQGVAVVPVPVDEEGLDIHRLPPEGGCSVRAVPVDGHGLGTDRLRPEGGCSAGAVPVDEQGVDMDGLPPDGGWSPGAVLVTPAHQFPTGAVLSPARRLGLVEWAERHDVLVIEDDYDAEYRYDQHAVGALQGMAPDRVVLGGSVSKTLAPGLRLGWLVVPPALSTRAARHKAAIDLMAPVLEQAALAELITSGSYERHIRRSRAVYKRRRDLVVELITDELPDAEVRGASAGLHLLVMTPSVDDEAAVEREAARQGVGVIGLGRHRHAPGPPGFVLGYGHLTDDQLRRSLPTFATAVRRTPRPREL